ncbi:hypothetical protein BpHYR1_004476 [Brachionus plicatilis]|uniref:Uncharacterized protein n=1 Tax=Brachionus plicatilis TaxID=10195 RepID=A0A3M7S9H0_BRAPC|nr:hypothetical protein BpHYR1_004476 [Brachionus plicatilis]
MIWNLIHLVFLIIVKSEQKRDLKSKAHAGINKNEKNRQKLIEFLCCFQSFFNTRRYKNRRVSNENENKKMCN